MTSSVSCCDPFPSTRNNLQVHRSARATIRRATRNKSQPAASLDRSGSNPTDSTEGGGARKKFRGAAAEAYTLDMIQDMLKKPPDPVEPSSAIEVTLRSIVGSRYLCAATAGDAASELQPKFIAEPATEQELACPLSCANQAGLAWGSPRDCISVMQAVKYQLDPKATLNLEGFVGGV
jgi:hypothetical protein